MTEYDVAILHDQFDTFGGAERVAIPIARQFDAPIYVITGEHEQVPADVEIRQIGSRWGRWARKLHYHAEDIYNMLRWQHVPELHDYDVLIETKTNPYWYVPKDDQVVVRYNHSTPRNLYDQHWRRGGHTATDALKIVQRMLYAQVLPYADRWLVNSDLVQRRMQLYWDQDSTVVYPPVDTEAADPDRRETGDYLLHLGRLARNKRIPLLREVAERVDVPVVVAGDGPERGVLDPLPDNVDYRGYVSEAEKWDLYAGAKATVMLAENEDFGIVPIESFASGTPVIAPAEGFTQHQIHHRETGYLTPPNPNAPDVVAGVEYLWDSDTQVSESEMLRVAGRFSTERFQEELREQVDRAVENARVTPSLYAHK